MGCVNSKRARSPSPAFDLSEPDRDNGSSSLSLSSSGNLDSLLRGRGGFGELEKIKEEPEKEENEDSVGSNSLQLRKSNPPSKKGNSEKRAAFSFKFGRMTEAENIAAGWPTWLSAVAGEAVTGWLPLRSDLFEKLDKIGQGTYSTVYRARNVESGRIVALKKVRFDTFQPESVRFMAREITILRRLDHPNVMKLEGLITSRLSCNIYLVFEYMEHDLSGLLSCPDIKFRDAQIKCYMRQLLSGVEHCHSRGIIHRDIKSSNILVNNEGILKVADFGLANYLSSRNRQPLTSRVVTLWYRPPELLLGSTSYGVSVDLWSVGCVFSELFIGRPILKGRTEVEQLHKIFKLCGSPPEEFWKRSKLPLATMFKPQHPYESTLRQRCKEFPKSAVNLIETFLSIEPYKRGTASSALDSEYFTTRPYACDPSSLPKYPPNKEIDAKLREEAQRGRAAARVRASGTSRNQRRVRKPLQESSIYSKVVPKKEMGGNTQFPRRNNGGNAYNTRGKGATECRETMKSSYDTVSEASQGTEVSQGASIRSVPVQVTESSGYEWPRRRRADATSSRLYGQASSRSQNVSAAKENLDSKEQEEEEVSSRFRSVVDSLDFAKRGLRRHNMSSLDPSSVKQAKHNLDLKEQEDEEDSIKFHSGLDSNENSKRGLSRQRCLLDQSDSFDASHLYDPRELAVQKRAPFSGPLSSHSLKIDQRKGYKERVQLSGPLLTRSPTDDESQESQIHQVAGRSRFYGDS